MCEGAEGLRAVLLDDEQIRLNSVAMEAFYADQNAKAGLRRLDIEQTQMLGEALTKLNN